VWDIRVHSCPFVSGGREFIEEEQVTEGKIRDANCGMQDARTAQRAVPTITHSISDSFHIKEL
jgi:hypothetical protein